MQKFRATVFDMSFREWKSVSLRRATQGERIMLSVQCIQEELKGNKGMANSVSMCCRQAITL